MKAFPEHDREWVECLPYWEPGVLFPAQQPGKERYRVTVRLHVEANKERGTMRLEPEEVFFNLTMASNVAAFSDVLGEYIGHLYGFAHDFMLRRILGRAWDSYLRAPQQFGTRVWFRSVCQEACDAYL